MSKIITFQKNHCQEHHDGHHHNHEISLENKKAAIHIKLHEGAVIGSVKYRHTGAYQPAVEALKACMKNMAGQIQQDGGFIGHIKFFVTKSTGGVMLSLTECDEVLETSCEAEEYHIEGACIAFGISVERMKKILLCSFSSAGVSF